MASVSAYSTPSLSAEAQAAAGLTTDAALRLIPAKAHLVQGHRPVVDEQPATHPSRAAAATANVVDATVAALRPAVGNRQVGDVDDRIGRGWAGRRTGSARI